MWYCWQNITNKNVLICQGRKGLGEAKQVEEFDTEDMVPPFHSLAKHNHLATARGCKTSIHFRMIIWEASCRMHFSPVIWGIEWCCIPCWAMQHYPHVSVIQQQYAAHNCGADAPFVQQQYAAHNYGAGAPSTWNVHSHSKFGYQQVSWFRLSSVASRAL